MSHSEHGLHGSHKCNVPAKLVAWPDGHGAVDSEACCELGGSMPCWRGSGHGAQCLSVLWWTQLWDCGNALQGTDGVCPHQHPSPSCPVCWWRWGGVGSAVDCSLRQPMQASLLWGCSKHGASPQSPLVCTGVSPQWQLLWGTGHSLAAPSGGGCSTLLPASVVVPWPPLQLHTTVVPPSCVLQQHGEWLLQHT